MTVNLFIGEVSLWVLWIGASLMSGIISTLIAVEPRFYRNGLLRLFSWFALNIIFLAISASVREGTFLLPYNTGLNLPPVLLVKIFALELLLYAIFAIDRAIETYRALHNPSETKG
ncbi:MAG: hypothetical protein AAB432_00820 [Patescibacteria group bacterium]